MHEFAEEYVANLKPREERYDTRLGDDFYVATFPNGIKTWSYVYEVNGYTRRQTLGIYPEMALEQALEGLYSARRTRAVEADLAEAGMDGTQVRKTEDSPINLTAKLRVPNIKLPVLKGRFFAGVVTGLVVSMTVAIAAWVFLAPGLIVEIPVAATHTLRPAVAAGVPSRSNSVVDESPAAPDQDAATVSEPVAAVAAVVAADATVAAADTMVAAAANTTSEAPDELLVEQPPEPGASQLELRQLQKDLAGTLAWAQLTSEIKDGEPVDHLSWLVELGQAPKRVFYFVRVRGMAGGLVTYRWRHQGKLLKEDSVKVGQGWHSPAYSGITLTSERLGRWQVEVYGPDGQALGSEEFETRMTTNETAQLSRR